MGEQTSDFYEFGRFRLKSDERVLLRGEEFVPLTPKAFDILLALLENDGRIVRKDDLMKKVWPDTFVEEGNLTQNVSLLRKALGESANGPQFIETVPRRGYRFVAPVNRGSENSQDQLVENAAKLPTNRQQTKPGIKAGRSISDSGLRTFLTRRLSAVALTLLILVIAVACVVYLNARHQPGASPSAIQSIAVLPFVDDSVDGDAE